LRDNGIVGNVHYVQANAEELPFPDDYFDAITISFCLRNVTDKPAALAEMTRVLKPGGRLLVLEFSQPALEFLRPIYDLYSFQVLPRLGALVAGDRESYQYLAESIRMHPNQYAMLQMLEDAGLEDCRYHNLSGGIVALHIGQRY